jgi:hypothetical protein
MGFNSGLKGLKHNWDALCKKENRDLMTERERVYQTKVGW